MAVGFERPNICLLKGVPVLVVEDAWLLAKALKSALEQMGMHVIGPTATTAEARRLTAAQSPRLAVIDINLKQETSYDLIDEASSARCPSNCNFGLRRAGGIWRQRGSIPAKAVQRNRVDYDDTSCSRFPLLIG
jgi:CheY-like chemotaxis protein